MEITSTSTNVTLKVIVKALHFFKIFRSKSESWSKILGILGLLICRLALLWLLTLQATQRLKIVCLLVLLHWLSVQDLKQCSHHISGIQNFLRIHNFEVMSIKSWRCRMSSWCQGTTGRSQTHGNIFHSCWKGRLDRSSFQIYIRYKVTLFDLFFSSVGPV